MKEKFDEFVKKKVMNTVDLWKCLFVILVFSQKVVWISSRQSHQPMRQEFISVKKADADQTENVKTMISGCSVEYSS